MELSYSNRKGLEAEYLVPGLRQLRVELSYNNRDYREGLEAEYLVQFYGSLGWSFHTTIEKG